MKASLQSSKNSTASMQAVSSPSSGMPVRGTTKPTMVAMFSNAFG